MHAQLKKQTDEFQKFMIRIRATVGQEVTESLCRLFVFGVVRCNTVSMESVEPCRCHPIDAYLFFDQYCFSVSDAVGTFGV